MQDNLNLSPIGVSSPNISEDGIEVIEIGEDANNMSVEFQNNVREIICTADGEGEESYKYNDYE
jgi:hypothetical protein